MTCSIDRHCAVQRARWLFFRYPIDRANQVTKRVEVSLFIHTNFAHRNGGLCL